MNIYSLIHIRLQQTGGVIKKLIGVSTIVSKECCHVQYR